MYIRDKLIIFLKIKNAISSFLGIFLIIGSVSNMASLISVYWGDWETIIEAKSTPDSVIFTIVGIILLICAFISKNMICDVYFYSSYFEGDLDGEIKYSDLTAITGKNIYLVKMQLHFFKIVYMKHFKFKKVKGKEQIELFSKKCTCECRVCGAFIEKKEYFAGKCSYCGSSDVFAHVLTSKRFYSITHQMSGKNRKPEFYYSKHHKLKKALFVFGLCFGISISFIALIYFFSLISNYNDKKYLYDVLMSGTSYSSYALIKSEILNDIIFIIGMILTILPLIWAMGLRMKYILLTENCSKIFSRYKTPFIKATSLPVLNNNRKRGIKAVKGAICRHYLLNCSFEKHGSVLKVALARKIIKDECPTCGASIVGAVDENYKCKYCGNMIMGVICKK